MKTINIGGNRLGSGNRLNVTLSSIDRSNHDLSKTWRSTASAGTLIPFMCQIGLPGDTWEIDLDTMVMTLPTIAPLFGSFKVQLDVFECPIRLYNSWLHNNKLNIGNDPDVVKFPIFNFPVKYKRNVNELDADAVNNMQVNPSCVLKYLGISGGGINKEPNAVAERQFNAIPILAYWDIYKNYYANKQEQIGAVIHSGNEEVIDLRGFSMKIEKDPNEPGQFVLFQTIDITQGPKSNANPTYSGYNAITLFKFTTQNKPNLKLIRIWTYNSNTPTTLHDWLLKAYGPDYGNGFTQVGREWLLNVIITVKDMLSSGAGLIWSYEINADFNSSVAVEPRVAFFPLENLDKAREIILGNNSGAATNISTFEFPPFNWVVGMGADNFRLQTQEGLAVKTYQSDLFNNWVRTEWVNDIANKSSVNVIGGKFTLDQLNISKKLYEYYNRIAVSGGSYDDWIEATYDIEKLKVSEIPVYKGGLIKELSFEEVTAMSKGDKMPLGTLAGKGRLTNKNVGGKVVIKCDEPCYIMGIFSITPRIDYSQGNEWHVHLKDMGDLHVPQLDGIGFQDLITEQMAYWDTHYINGKWVQKSAGKQPAWLNYMTDVNKVYGNFSIENNSMFMTLNRRYHFNQDMNIKDLTTYIDPNIYNNIFADASLDAQNFWVQIKMDCNVRRKMSAKIIPNI